MKRYEEIKQTQCSFSIWKIMRIVDQSINPTLSRFFFSRWLCHSCLDGRHLDKS